MRRSFLYSLTRDLSIINSCGGFEGQEVIGTGTLASEQIRSLHRLISGKNSFPLLA